MAFLQLLFNSRFIFLNILIIGNSKAVKSVLPNYIIPKHYEVALSQDSFNNTFFNGACQIFITINQPTWNISFYAHRSHIEVFQCVLYKINSSDFQEPIHFGHNPGTDTFDVYFDKHLLGNYVLDIKFSTIINNEYGEGLFITSYTINNKGHKKLLFATHPQVTEARRVFPCWDEPAFKATFNVSIKHHNTYTALSNMPVRNTSAQGKNMMWTYFKETPLMPTSLVWIMVCDFFSVSINKRINISMRSRRQLVSDLKLAKVIIEDVTQRLVSQHKLCEKLAKVDHVAMLGLLPDRAQTLGLVSYREIAMIYNKTLDSAGHKIDVVRLIGHEVTHQCFDNLDNYSWWSYSWLNEGIATLFAIDAVSKTFPDVKTMLYLFITQIQRESLHLDTDFIMKFFSPKSNNTTENNLLSPFSHYIKAPAVLHMLKYLLTDKVFWNGINIFLENISLNGNNKMHSTNFNNLWITMQHVLDKSYNVQKFNVTEVMNSWTELNHYPIIKVEKHNNLNENTHTSVKISVENMDTLDQIIWIPITIQEYSHSSDTWSSHNMRLISFNPDNYTIFLPSSSKNWMIINTHRIGYYRVDYDLVHWGRIASYLSTSKEITDMHVLNRGQIIDDAFYFLMNNELPLFVFLQLTKYLERETNYVAWYPMIRALEFMSNFFIFNESEPIKIHMRNILNQLLEIIGYNERPTDDDYVKCLRQEAVKWACIFDASDCKYVATMKLHEHLEDAEKYKILPWWKAWTFCNGLRGNGEVWLQVFDMWSIKLDTKLLNYLSCSEHTHIVLRNMNTMTAKLQEYESDHKNIRMLVNARINYYFFTIARHAKNNVALEYILKNFEGLKPREVNTHVALICIINHVHSEEQLNKILEVVTDKENKIKAAINLKFSFYDRKELLMERDIAVRKFLKFFEQTTWLVTQKINVRLSEIRNQLDYFHMFMPYN